MKKKIILMLLYIPCCCFAQYNQEDSSKITIMYDSFYDIEFKYDSIQPTTYGLQMINKIGSLIVFDKEIEDSFWFVFQIAVSMEEQKNDIDLEFKRVLFVLNYLKKNYKINSNNFLFQYWDTIPLEFSMRFSLLEKVNKSI
jgi:hypothetical protein